MAATSSVVIAAELVVWSFDMFNLFFSDLYICCNGS